MTDRETRDRGVIEDFRANRGKVGGRFESRPILLLTVTGAKSGRRITKPLAYLRDGERLLVFAAKAGAPTHPAWYHNLVANPTVTVEVGDQTYEAKATTLTGAERDRLYAQQAAASPGLADYQAKTSRTFPVIALEPVPDTA